MVTIPPKIQWIDPSLDLVNKVTGHNLELSISFLWIYQLSIDQNNQRCDKVQFLSQQSTLEPVNGNKDDLKLLKLHKNELFFNLYLSLVLLDHSYKKKSCIKSALMLFRRVFKWWLFLHGSPFFFTSTFAIFMTTRVQRSANSYLSVIVLIGLNEQPLLLINSVCSIFKVEENCFYSACEDWPEEQLASVLCFGSRSKTTDCDEAFRISKDGHNMHI